MSHLVHGIDVPVMINGRKCTLNSGTDALSLEFAAQTCLIAHVSIDHIVHCKDRMALCLNEPKAVVPGTKAVRGVVMTQYDVPWDAAVRALASLPMFIGTDEADPVATACGRTHVQIIQDGLTVLIWTSKQCTVVDGVDSVILQRTRGGMSTFDVHIIYSQDKVQTVEMLPHSMLRQWKDTYGDLAIDVGADPLDPAEIVPLMAAVDFLVEQEYDAGNPIGVPLVEQSTSDDEWVPHSSDNSSDSSDYSDCECDTSSSE